MDKMTPELSARMRMVSDLVPAGSVAADVGCDHGYVAIRLVQDGICDHVLAMDVRPGPLEAARKNAGLYGVADQIDLRLSDGLKSMHLTDGIPEADTLICAGMGGRLICHILEDSEEKILGMKTLILQPQSEPFLVRELLRRLGFFIDREDMLCEGGKYYSVLRARNERMTELAEADSYAAVYRSCPESLTSIEWEGLCDRYGALLIRDRHPVLLEFLNWQKTKNEEILRVAGENIDHAPQLKLMAETNRLLKILLEVMG